MHRTDGTDHVSNMFSDGDPGVPRLGTVIEEDWLNAIQEELMSLLGAAGISPVKGTNTQVLASLIALLAPRTGNTTYATDYHSAAGKNRIIYRTLTSGNFRTTEILLTINANWNAGATRWDKDQAAIPAYALTLAVVADTVGSAHAGTGLFMKQVANVSNFTDADWLIGVNRVAPTLLNSWADVGGAQKVAGYFRDPSGAVNLEGSVVGGTSGTVIFTLPAGFRPSAVMTFPIVSDNAFGYVGIAANGDVSVTAGSVASNVNLNGIRFYPGS